MNDSYDDRGKDVRKNSKTASMLYSEGQSPLQFGRVVLMLILCLAFHSCNLWLLAFFAGIGPAIPYVHGM